MARRDRGRKGYESRVYEAQKRLAREERAAKGELNDQERWARDLVERLRTHKNP